MADYPDIYADGFGLSAGPFGVTVTLQLTDPSGEPGVREESNVTIGRIRLSRELAKALATQIEQILTASAQGVAQGTSSVKH